MDFEVAFPEERTTTLVETDMMKEIMGSTIANQPGGGMGLWYGNAGIGKTTTALLLEQKIAKAFKRNPANPNAFLAKHIQVGEVAPWSGNEQKQGIKCLYAATVGQMDEGDYRRLPTNQLAADTVYGLQRLRIKIVFIDEAGCLSEEAIRGMVLVRDIAQNEGWTISLIFIGMDDLPQKLNRLPQIRRRVHHWCYFEEYSLDETWKLLAGLHPHFKTLDRKNKDHNAQVKFIHETFGGFPGLIVPLINQMDYLLQLEKCEVNEQYLRTVHYMMVHGKDKSLAKSKHSYKPRTPKRR